MPSLGRIAVSDLKYPLAVLCAYYLISKMRIPAIGDALPNSFANLSLAKAQRHKILVVGCAYGGITAVLNLLDLERGKPIQAIYPGADVSGRRLKGGLEVTVIDERDGYCKY